MNQYKLYSHAYKLILLCFFCQQNVILPTIMVETLGHELSRFVVLNDSAYNEIEVLVEQIDGRVCFSQGWLELNAMYDLKHGGAVTLVNVQPSRFVIKVKDRYGEEISCPHHDPPMSFKFNRELFPITRGFLFTAKAVKPYRHDRNNFKFSFSKWLSEEEVNKGYMVWCYYNNE